MTGSPIASELDHVHCIEGLAFLAMFAAAMILHLQADKRLPWFWLALAGLGQGLNAWLGISALSGSAPQAFSCIRLAIGLASFVALLEFGRRGVAQPGRQGLRGWVYLPLVVLASLVALSGEMAALNATCRYALAMPGGLMAAFAAWKASQSIGQGERPGLRLAWQAMLVTTLATGLIVPKATFFPASRLNFESFSSAVHFPVEWLLALGGLAAAIGIWRYHGNRESVTARPGPIRGWLFPAACVLLVAIGCVLPDGNARIVDGAVQGDSLGPTAAVTSGTATADQDNAEQEAIVREGRAVRHERMNFKFLLTSLGLVSIVALGVLADRWLHGRPAARSRSSARSAGIVSGTGHRA